MKLAAIILITISGIILSSVTWAQDSPEPQSADAFLDQSFNLRYVQFLPETDFPINQTFKVFNKNLKTLDEVALTVNKQISDDLKTRYYQLEGKYILGQGFTNLSVKFQCVGFSPIQSAIDINPASSLMAIYTEYKFGNAKIRKKTEQFEQTRNILCPLKAIDHNSLFYLARCFDAEQLKTPAYLFIVYPQKCNSFLTQVLFEGYQSYKTTDDCSVFSVNYGEFKEYYWQQKESPWQLIKVITDYEEWTAVL